MRKIGAVFIVLLGLPVFLFLYQPAWQLGGFGMLLGMIGITITPFVVLGSLIFAAYSLWHSGTDTQ